MADLETLADIPIRRACGFAGLAIGTTMLALSFDLAAAFRSGGAMAAILCLGLALAAWRTPRRDMRRTEFWSLVTANATASLLHGLPTSRAQALLAEVMRRRLLWHADRIGLAALGLWLPGELLWLLR